MFAVRTAVVVAVFSLLLAACTPVPAASGGSSSPAPAGSGAGASASPATGASGSPGASPAAGGALDCERLNTALVALPSQLGNLAALRDDVGWQAAFGPTGVTTAGDVIANLETILTLPTQPVDTWRGAYTELRDQLSEAATTNTPFASGVGNRIVELAGNTQALTMVTLAIAGACG
jgi:hypothetical protein